MCIRVQTRCAYVYMDLGLESRARARACHISTAHAQWIEAAQFITRLEMDHVPLAFNGEGEGEGED